MITYDMYGSLYCLRIGNLRGRFYTSRAKAIRALGRYVRRFGKTW